jgi:hypothetical protein
MISWSGNAAVNPEVRRIVDTITGWHGHQEGADMRKLNTDETRRLTYCYDLRSLVLTLLYTVPEYVEAPVNKKNAVYDMVVRSMERR